MDPVYPQVWLSTAGTVSVLVCVVILEALSLGFLGIVTAEFMLLRRKHLRFFTTMNSPAVHAERFSRFAFRIYIIATLLVTALTAVLFLFQPHLL